MKRGERFAKCKGFTYLKQGTKEVRYQTTDYGEILCEDRLVHDLFGNRRWESDILLSRAAKENQPKRLPTGKAYIAYAERGGQLRLFDRPYRGN